MESTFRSSRHSERTIPQQPYSFLWRMLAQYPWRVSIIYLSIILAFATEGFFPFFVKKLVDETVSFSGEIRRIWLWGLGIFGAYVFYAFWYRTSGYLGIKLIVTVKTEIYRLFNQYLACSDLNDEAGKISKSIALIGEGSEILIYKAFWHSSGFLLNFLIHLSLILSTHYYIFGIFAGWVLLHIVSNSFLVKWRKQYTLKYQEATCHFNGRLVEFTRQRIYEPGKQINCLSDEMYQLDEALMGRASCQLLDWNISETILLVYNFIHGFFIVLALILILVLWQDKLISTGDIAMSVGIMISTQRMLKEVSILMNVLTEAYSQVEAGLRYISTKQLKGLTEGK